jgi:hypothetical protein
LFRLRFATPNTNEKSQNENCRIGNAIEHNSGIREVASAGQALDAAIGNQIIYKCARQSLGRVWRLACFGVNSHIKAATCCQFSTLDG